MITSLYPTFQNAGQAMMDAMPEEMTKDLEWTWQSGNTLWAIIKPTMDFILF